MSNLGQMLRVKRDKKILLKRVILVALLLSFSSIPLKPALAITWNWENLDINRYAGKLDGSQNIIIGALFIYTIFFNAISEYARYA